MLKRDFPTLIKVDQRFIRAQRRRACRQSEYERFFGCRLGLIHSCGDIIRGPLRYITSDERLAERVRMLANHGQSQKYHHHIVGCNSRLDTLQAAVLEVKLRHLNSFTEARQTAAQYYDKELSSLSNVYIPIKSPFSTHVYH